MEFEAFWIVRFPISDGSYECIVTNRRQKNFPQNESTMIYHPGARRRFTVQKVFPVAQKKLCNILNQISTDEE